MPDKLPDEERAGRLAENIIYFARALRAAGIPLGPGAVLDALEAVKAAGVGTRDDFYWTLHSVSSPGRPNATLRRGDSNQRPHPRWSPAIPPWFGGGEPLRSPSRADRQRLAPSAHRANGSPGNTGS